MSTKIDQQLVQLINKVNSSLDVETVLNYAMETAEEALQAEASAIFEVDPERGDLFFRLARGEKADQVKTMRLKVGEGVAGWVAQTGSPLYAPDVSKEARFNRRIDRLLGFTTHSIVCVPLKSKGRTLGVIEMINDGVRGKFREGDVSLLSVLADYAAIAIENARHFQEVQESSIIDDVTGLFNSRYLYQFLDQELKRSKRYEKKFTLIFIDLDHFKSVNDTHGHLAGSALLREVGEVFRQALRGVDVVIRYGGDEFVIILPETGKSAGLKVTARLREALNRREFHPGEGVSLRITASFGVGSFPDDAKFVPQIIHAADQAMYRVKESTRDGIAAAGDQE